MSLQTYPPRASIPARLGIYNFVLVNYFALHTRKW